MPKQQQPNGTPGKKPPAPSVKVRQGRKPRRHRLDEPIAPVTLGNMRSLGVRAGCSTGQEAEVHCSLISFPVCSYHWACEADDVISTTIRRQYDHGPEVLFRCPRLVNCSTRPIGFGCAATPAVTV
jgi:hypothetical protein